MIARRIGAGCLLQGNVTRTLPGNETPSERLELRVTLAEKSAYDDAANASGIERSDWIREVLAKAAKARK